MIKTIKLAGVAVLTAALLAPVFSDTSDIRLNSIGFLPNAPKVASINVRSGGGAPASGAAFSVVDSATGQSVYSGQASKRVYNIDSRDTVLLADFSTAVTSPGRYYLDVQGGVGRSPVFGIGDDVFKEPFRAAMLGFYLWRCGASVNARYNNQDYTHAACHLGDGDQQYIGGGGVRDAKGGWHDAGDYNKYTVNSGVSVALLLKAWEHFGEALDKVDLIAVNKERNIPKFLTEVKYNLDWVSKMQYGTQGQVSHKLSALNFGEVPALPENDDAGTRYFAPGGSESVGSFVGMLAQAARVYAPYDSVFADSCLTKALRSYAWLESNQSFAAADQTAFGTGTYTTGDNQTSAPMKVNYDADKRLWAAIELWEATGESKYLNDFEKRVNAADHLIPEIEWGEWGGVSTIACVTYLASKREGRDSTKVDAVRKRLISVADAIVDSTNKHGYGRAFGTGKYYWGGHGALTATSYILNSAFIETRDRKYRDAGHDILSYIFGRNYYGRSFVTGVGRNPPVSPHDRRSQATNKPWPGYIIGGPHKNKGGWGVPPELTNCATDAVCWKDDDRDYWTNEIAINWNASMVYAVAAYLPDAEPKEPPPPPPPPPPPDPPDPPDGVAYGPNAAKRALYRGMMRVVQVKNGRAMSDIPVGAKIYTLNGKFIARKKSADVGRQLVNRNGVFLIKVEGLKD